MIEIRNVSKTFYMKDSEIHAVDDVSLKIADGEIYGVIGYSGAGKSTLVRCINFLETPDSGVIRVRDDVLFDASMPETIKERRVQELQESDKKMREFERRAASDIAAQRTALTKPITDRVQDAIRTAGEQGNFDLVLDTAVTPVAYTGPATVDITPMVKALLGLQ